MSGPQTDNFFPPPAPYEWEPERYELREAPKYHFEVDRREFFKAIGNDFPIDERFQKAPDEPLTVALIVEIVSMLPDIARQQCVLI